MFRVSPGICAALAVSFVATTAALANARHVVVIVWDGLRPDSITEETTPVLKKLLERGVSFQRHHSSFVTSTEVNGVVFGTGMYPEHSGLIANIEYRPSIDFSLPIAVENSTAVRRGDEVSGGHYLHAATLPEILSGQATPLRSVVAGSKAVTLLLDRSSRRKDAQRPLIVEGEAFPQQTQADLVARLGRFPATGATKGDRDTWTTRALVEELWSHGLPSYTHLWLAEPDWAQHHTGPGSPTSLEALASCDRQLARVVDELTKRHALEDTDILVVSDHGFSTISENADLATDLSTVGLTTARAIVGQPVPGTVLVTGLGASSGLYVAGHDPAVISKVVEFLQTKDYVGVIFTRSAMPGTFPLSAAKIGSTDAPDILVALRWNDQASATGTKGCEISELGAGRKAGQGTHAGLSPYDLHNTLVAAGPDFRAGAVDTVPTGNVDVAPTVLWILGVKPVARMDGRVLTEALTIPGPSVGTAKSTRIKAEAVTLKFVWQQYLEFSVVNDVTYLDEGNGAVSPR